VPQVAEKNSTALGFPSGTLTWAPAGVMAVNDTAALDGTAPAALLLAMEAGAKIV
jgi:hypothetical protein